MDHIVNGIIKELKDDIWQFSVEINLQHYKKSFYYKTDSKKDIICEILLDQNDFVIPRIVWFNIIKKANLFTLFYKLLEKEFPKDAMLDRQCPIDYWYYSSRKKELLLLSPNIRAFFKNHIENGDITPGIVFNVHSDCYYLVNMRLRNLSLHDFKPKVLHK